MKISDILQLNKEKFHRFLILIGASFMLVAPGACLLLLENNIDYFINQTRLSIFISVIISIPLLFLGAVVYLHPYKTLQELKYLDKSNLVPYHLLMGICVWSIINAAALYFTVHHLNEWFAKNLSNDLKMQYIAVYFVLIMFFGTIFYINSSRKI